MTPPKKPPHHDDHKNLEKKIHRWVDTFKANLGKDFSRADLNKIRSAMTWREKLLAVKIAADGARIGTMKDPHQQMRALRNLMPQIEKLFGAVERGTGKKLEEFGKYLPDEAKTQTVANSLRTFGAEKLAKVVEAHIPPAPPKPDASIHRPGTPTDTPPKAPRRRILSRSMPMPA
ncbi:MAG: hypothetical protein Alpg2KO_24590 [Alphaproteobacteria bacterium]